jgi:hypothetical protein
MIGTECPRGHVPGGTDGTPLKGVCPVCPAATPSETYLGGVGLQIVDQVALHDGEPATDWAWLT